MTIPPAIAALLAEHAAPTHASTAQTLTITGTVLDLVATLGQQQAVYRRLLWHWKTSPDAGLKDKLEWLKQTFDHADLAALNLARDAEALVTAWERLDRYVADVRLVVDPPAVATVTVTVIASTPRGTVTPASAIVRAADGAVIVGRAVVWASSDPTTASVDAMTGIVTGLKAGTVAITATCDGVAGHADLLITQH